ncbi:MAG: AAA family ATPase [Candidatus Omnitrophota bacterium]
MVKVIAVANQKGGCGKTTTSINLSASLSFLGKKVLLIDLDPQAHSSIGLGVNPEELEQSLFDVFDEDGKDVDISDVIVKGYKNLDLAPAQVILSAIEQKLSGIKGRESKLAEKIKTLKNAYDYVIIDCPPSLGLLTFNALCAADEVLVPVEPSFFSLHGLKKLLETVALVREVTGRAITTHSVITMFDRRTKHSRELVEDIKNFFGDNNLSVIVRKNIKLQEAAQAGKPITEFDKNSLGFKDYMQVAVEIMERCGRDDIPSISSFLAKEDPSPFSVREEVSGNDVVATATTVAIEIQTASRTDVAVSCYPKVVTGGVLFSFCAQEAQCIEIAGDFNNWERKKLNTPGLSETTWTTVVPLSLGVYRYKYVVDDVWVVDPANEHRAPNSFGGEDCIFEVS